jgi:uncharacterized protein YqgV (UPF0045/DUF77 family)
MATADFSALGLGRPQASASEYLAEIRRRLEAQDRVGFRMHAMGTSLEGEVADILAVVGEMHAVPLELGLPRPTRSSSSRRAMAHAAVSEAAVIARPDERWSERPLACVVLEDGGSASVEDLREHLSDRVAKWWIPSEFAFIDEVPKTSVGKFDKKVLRRRLEEGELEVAGEEVTAS